MNTALYWGVPLPALEAVRKVGKRAARGAKAGAEEADKLFKGIGEGIEDVGRKL